MTTYITPNEIILQAKKAANLARDAELGYASIEDATTAINWLVEDSKSIRLGKSRLWEDADQMMVQAAKAAVRDAAFVYKTAVEAVCWGDDYRERIAHARRLYSNARAAERRVKERSNRVFSAEEISQIWAEVEDQAADQAAPEQEAEPAQNDAAEVSEQQEAEPEASQISEPATEQEAPADSYEEYVSIVNGLSEEELDRLIEEVKDEPISSWEEMKRSSILPKMSSEMVDDMMDFKLGGTKPLLPLKEKAGVADRLRQVATEYADRAEQSSSVSHAETCLTMAEGMESFIKGYMLEAKAIADQIVASDAPPRIKARAEGLHAAAELSFFLACEEVLRAKKALLYLKEKAAQERYLGIWGKRDCQTLEGDAAEAEWHRVETEASEALKAWENESQYNTWVGLRLRPRIERAFA